MAAVVGVLVVLLARGASSGGRPTNLLRHLPGHERHDLSQPPPRPRLAKLLGAPPPLTCPPERQTEAAATGMVSLASFLNTTTGADDAIAVRAAIAVAQNCSVAVFFPPGEYTLLSTVALPGNLELRGSGLQSSEFLPPQGARINGPKNGPAFLIAHTEKVHLVDLSILGQHTGVIVTDAALIKFSNVGIEAQFAGVGVEAPCTKDDSFENGGCNVAMGSNNTALVIENSFWVWLEDADLEFMPLYSTSPPGALDRKTQWGQRPSVIVRGDEPGLVYGIDTV